MASRQRHSPPSYSRRIVAPERASTGTFGQPPPGSTYNRYSTRDPRDPYISPRTSGEGVIPVSTETYRNGSLVSSNRPSNSYEPYSDPRRTSLPLADTSHRRSSYLPPVTASAAGRAGPAVIHQTHDRSTNAGSRPSDRYDRGGYYVTPSSSGGRNEHRKTNSIEDGKRSRVTEDRDRDSDYGRDHRRREPRYHLTGPNIKSSDADDYVGYEYTNPRDVFENTEPRHHTRRRGSVDAPSRDRPSTLMDSYASAKPVLKEIGPPPATRALEKFNKGQAVNRRGSLRDSVSSPTRSRDVNGYGSASDDDIYQVAPRPRRDRRDPAYYEREALYPSTRNETGRKFEDTDVAHRGFGIRAAHADPPHSRDGSFEARNRYADEPPPPPPDYPPEARRDDRKWESGKKQLDRTPETDRDVARDEDLEAPRKKDRDPAYERTRDIPPHGDAPQPRERHYPQERERDRYPQEEPRPREKRADDVSEASRRARPREGSAGASVALPLAAAAGTAAYAARDISNHKGPEEEQNRKKESKEKDAKSRVERRVESPDEAFTRQRHYVTKDDKREAEPSTREDPAAASMDPDEEFRMRVQQEADRVRQAKANTPQHGEESMQGRGAPRHRDDDDLESDGDSEEEDTSRALSVRPQSEENILDAPLVGEPAVVIENRENRVRIVEPPREKEVPRGILRKPTEKFPEYPDTVREGVAPHKDAKIPDIPAGTKWTKINRLIVNPQALKEAEERFEERKDFVIVLRAISKEEVQKLADRTQQIREEREQRHNHHPRHHHDRDHDRDRRHHRRDEEKEDDEDDDDEDEDDDEEDEYVEHKR